MTLEILASTAAILLSPLFSYIPGFSSWYDTFPPNLKHPVMNTFLLTSLDFDLYQSYLLPKVEGIEDGE